MQSNNFFGASQTKLNSFAPVFTPKIVVGSISSSPGNILDTTEDITEKHKAIERYEELKMKRYNSFKQEIDIEDEATDFFRSIAISLLIILVALTVAYVGIKYFIDVNKENIVYGTHVE